LRRLRWVYWIIGMCQIIRSVINIFGFTMISALSYVLIQHAHETLIPPAR
jgi:hypothetical protein